MKKLLCSLIFIFMASCVTASAAVTWSAVYNTGEYGEEADMYAKVVNSEKYSGKNSMKLYFNYPETPNTYLTLKVSAPSGSLSYNKTYKFSFMHKGTNVFAGRNYYWNKSSRTYVDAYAWDVAEYNWKKSEYTIKAGLFRDYKFDINLEGSRTTSAPAVVYVDDLKLVEVDSNGNEVGSNLITDPGFENVEIESTKLFAEGSHDGQKAEITAVINRSDYDGDTELYFAVYDRNGRLVNAVKENVIADENEESTYNFSFDYDIGNVFKVFAWDRSQSAICNVCEKKFADLDFELSSTSFVDFRINNVAALKKLRSECESKGIDCAYETVNIATAENFADYGNVQLSSGNKERAEYIYNCLSELYSETKDTLNGYLDGSRTPKEVVKYLHSLNSINGLSEYAKSTAGANRPTFFVGYGHFSGAVMANIGLFEKLGVNIVQVETVMSDFVSPDGNGGFVYNDTHATNFVNSVLNPARDRNIKVILLISPHYIPDWFTELYPEDSGIVTSSKWRELLKVYIDGLISKVSRYPSLHSICVTNEPGYNATSNKYDKPLYIDYLEEKYNDINALNSVYGTSYSNFESVVMPSVMPETNADSGVLNAYADYIEFNDKLFAEYHMFLKNTVQNVANGKPVHSKVMDIFGPHDTDYYRNQLNRGTDIYEFTKVFDVNGCDGTTALNHSDITTKSSFYDMMQSFNPAPVINSEDHVIIDGDTSYSAEQKLHVSLDLWNGAIHGRTSSVLWVWERTDEMNTPFSDSIANRPDCVAAVGKITLDLNRLAYEVTALQNVDSDAAIYYDTNARFRNRYMMNAMDKCHKALSALGQKVTYVTDETVMEGALEDVSVLVIPDAMHLPDSTVTKITEFKNSGGKVIAAGADCLVYNETGKKRDTSEISDAITETVVMTKSGVKNEYTYDSLTALTNTLDKYFERDIKVADLNGNICTDIEYRTVEYNGKTLIHICNHNMYESYTLTAGDEIVSDLISCKTIDLSKFKLEPGEYMLLS